MAYTDPVTWVAGNPLPASDLNTYVRDNFRFLHDKGGDLTAAATITPTNQFHKVTGNTQINNVTILAAGTRLVLWFTGTPILKHNNGGAGSLILQGAVNYTAAANDVLTFISDGTNWYQVGPSLGGTALQLAYNEFTANVTISATTEAGATTIVTATAVTFDGSTPVMVQFQCGRLAAGAADGVIICLFQDGSTLGQMGRIDQAQITAPVFLARRLTPAAGSHTYSIRAFRGTANGTANAGNGGSGNDLPGFIRIVKAA